VLTLGANESSWGIAPSDLPPSLSQVNGTVQGSGGSRGMEEKRWMYERIFVPKMTEDYPMA
jgi:hypothetical protein